MAIFNLFKKKNKGSSEKEEKVQNEKIEANVNVISKKTADKKVAADASAEIVNDSSKNENKKQSASTTKPVAKAGDIAKEGEQKAETKDVIKKAPAKKPVVNKATEDKANEKKPTVKKAEAPASAKKTERPIAPVKETQAKEAATTPITDSKIAYTGKFEINKSKDGKKFFFNLYASNKIGIATSQMYSSSQAALNGVKSVIANAPTAPIEDQSLKKYDTLPYPKWEIYVDNGGKYRFRLNASNGSCVCHSQGYTTKTACKNGIDSIIRSSKNAEIEKTYISKKEED